MLHIYFVGIVCFILANESAAQLTCYACTMHPDPYLSPNITQRLCSQFDGSATFQVDCPFSTFCMKKTFEISLQGGRKVYGTMRDCAPQKNSFYQVQKNGKWGFTHEVVDSIYTAGCSDSSTGLDLKTSSSQYCYCASNLCNGAATDPLSVSLLTTLTFLVILINV
ncbi:hypothetical protein M8J76_007566 [Diaphorina citri]|nr:hypothetical protein M8J75_013345 [Diaphorina citri]KAI5722383.1 hypothetical protein M8J76_007566 [Diaphorina citri]